MRRLLLVTLFLLLALPAASARTGDDFTALKEKFLAKIPADRQTADRQALVAEVADRDTKAAAELLVGGVDTLADKIEKNQRALAKIEKEYQPLDTNTDVAEDGYQKRNELRRQIDDLDEILLSDEQVVDRIGAALATLKSEDGRAEVEKAALRAKPWRTRATAVGAAAVYPTATARTTAVKALKDKDERVVLSALDGLGRRADEATVADVLGCLDHDLWVVKVGAVQALAAIGSPKAVRPLIEALSKTTGRVQDEVNKALQKLTGQHFDADYDSWKRWYEDHKEEFEGKDAKPLRGRGKKEGPRQEDPTYYGIQSKSKRVVYVIDISGSMLLEIGGKGVSTPRPGEEERPSGPKIEIAKRELKNAIRKLPEDAIFNIITFNHLVKVWSPAMVQAKQDNKNKAYLFINDLKASGSTYTYGALKAAFKLAGMGATDPNYASGVDTIFLLSDGAPTDQSFPTSKLMDPDKILEAVREWNKLGKVVIHAIAIDPNTQGASFIRFMKQLAEENNGEYVERG